MKTHRTNEVRVYRCRPRRREEDTIKVDRSGHKNLVAQ